MSKIVVLTAYLASISALLLALVVSTRINTAETAKSVYRSIVSSVKTVLTWERGVSGTGENGGWPYFCEVCGQGPMARESDVETHKEAKHRVDEGKEEKDGAMDGTIDGTQMVTRGDLVDDYDIDWDTDADDGALRLQEPTGGTDTDWSTHPVYQWVQEQLDKQGVAKVTRQTHVGQVRGGHIVKEFRRAVRRVPNDSLDRYELENWGTGDYPVRIRAS